MTLNERQDLRDAQHEREMKSERQRRFAVLDVESDAREIHGETFPGANAESQPFLKRMGENPVAAITPKDAGINH